MLAKAPQIMLFQYSDLMRPAEDGRPRRLGSLATSFLRRTREVACHSAIRARPSNYATAAGYALDKVNAVLGKLGKPIGIASYKPYQSTGEDFLHNYLGMIGIPIDLYPEFPADAKTVLLTEQAKFDPDLVNKIKTHLEKGGNVVITSGLLKATPGQGHRADRRNSRHRQRAARQRVLGRRRAPAREPISARPTDVLVPEISFLTNDAWPLVRGTANGRGAPLLLMDHYSKGILFVLTIPENTNDLYALPQPVLTSIKQYIMNGFPVWMDAPAKVSLFAYDNKSFVVESYLDAPTQVTISTLGVGPASAQSRHRRSDRGHSQRSRKAAAGHAPQRTEFKFEVPPHSFVALALR